MLRAALAIGLTARDFWRMSPAAMMGMTRMARKGREAETPVRCGGLSDCP